MDQREAKRMVCREVAGIVADLQGDVPSSLDIQDGQRWSLACSDLYVELMRRAGVSTLVQHVEGQLSMEVPE